MSIIVSWKLCASSGEPNGQLLHCLYGNCRPPEETLPGRETELASQLDQVTVEGSILYNPVLPDSSFMKWSHRCALTTVQMCSLLYFSVTNQILLTNSLPTVLLCFLVSSDLKTFEESSLFQGIALAWLGVLGRER